MLRDIFSWNYSIGLALGFYGLSVGLWSLALTTDPYVFLFAGAMGLCLLSLVLSLGWLYTRAEFQRNPARAVGRPRKLLFDLNRERRHAVRVLLTMLLFIWFGGTEIALARSYSAHALEKQVGEVTVLLDDNKEMTPINVPFGDKAFTDALRKTLVSLATVRYSDNSDGKGNRVNIIVKNTSRVTIKNVDIHIICTEAIEAYTEGSHKFSDKEVTYEMRELHPFYNFSEMAYFSIRVPDAKAADFIVQVEGDNMEPYSGAVRAEFNPALPKRN